MQSVPSRIWTRGAVSIPYDDNHYTTGTSKWFLKLYTVWRYTQDTFFLKVINLTSRNFKIKRFGCTHGQQVVSLFFISLQRYSKFIRKLLPKVGSNSCATIYMCVCVCVCVCVWSMWYNYRRKILYFYKPRNKIQNKDLSCNWKNVNVKKYTESTQSPQYQNIHTQKQY